MAATTTQSMGSLPSGLAICVTVPDMFYLPELVTGGLVWILVASTHVEPANPLGWVMFVSVFCFFMTLLWVVLFIAGCHKNGSAWVAAVRPQDFAYHALAALFYLSAGVNLAFITFIMKSGALRIYQIDIAAVVFAFMATLLYFIHAVLSSLRWKHF
ncbi:myelin and lymphocyte protein-like isoform X1 [Hippocampus comes]|uniref:myelin and lymphocyte protein-like isoform X1 n=1 Tax=Hippocampus comes TaxID=109280 RepID=UPI00094E00D2|nr:PREDICTED: myelin and lymphocyte protein-like isoform X1 [Hippocampus comes]